MKFSRQDVILLILVALIVLVCGLLFFGLLWGYNGMGGFGMMGPGMMGGIGIFWLLLVALVIFILAGTVWWVTLRTDRGDNPMQTKANCPNCHRTIQPEWHVCPFCGEPLQGDRIQ